MDKSEIRSSYLQKREALSAEELKALSIKVQESFIETPEFRDASGIILYSGFRGEVATELIARKALDDGRLLAYPKVMGHAPPHLAFFKVGSLGDLTPGAFGILEPGDEALGTGEMEIKDFDSIVVPGVAFDGLGSRVGFGKGFYDRRLSEARATIVALAYGFQVMEDALPVEPHDVRMDMVVTEKEVLRF